MSWHTVTWDDADGATPFITALTAALTAHPAWEFVEETVEVMTTKTEEGVWFDLLTFPFQVWRCRGDANGTEKDFYFAFSRSIQRYPDVEGTGEGGYIPTFGAAGYDVATHTASDVLGKSTWQNVVLDSDGRIEGTNGYPWLQAKVEDGGTSWGYWGAPNQAPTDTDELNHITRGTQHPMSQTAGRTYSVPVFGPADTPPTTQTSAIFRITERGVFFAFMPDGETKWKSPTYLGFYEYEAVAEELRGDVPIMLFGLDEYLWNAQGSQGSLVAVTQLRQGRRSEFTAPGAWFRSPDYYGFNYDTTLEVETERARFPAPGTEPYVVLPIGLAPTGESGFDVSSPVYIAPGIWMIVQNDVTPTGWTNDGTTTATSPDGVECSIFNLVGSWFVIDKEMI